MDDLKDKTQRLCSKVADLQHQIGALGDGDDDALQTSILAREMRQAEKDKMWLENAFVGLKAMFAEKYSAPPPPVSCDGTVMADVLNDEHADDDTQTRIEATSAPTDES
jgi:hypothetical protein